MEILPKSVRDLVYKHETELRKALQELRENPDASPIVAPANGKDAEVRIRRVPFGREH